LRKDKTLAATAIVSDLCEKDLFASDFDVDDSNTPQSIPTIPTIEITIGNATYIINSFFKPTGKTASEKLYNLMEKEVENSAEMRYNGIIPKESLAVGNLGRIGL